MEHQCQIRKSQKAKTNRFNAFSILRRFRNIELNSMQTDLPEGIRHAKVEDIDELLKIEKKCFPEPTAYSKRQLSYLCLQANSSCLLETNGKVTRGFIIATYRHGSFLSGIETLDVDPAFTKLGIGLKLLTAAETEMRKRGVNIAQLEVSAGNHAAINLYKKAGYTETERIKDYYRYDHNGTRNAIRMTKTL